MSSNPGPLSGTRIVDLTQFILGPYATQTLGDLGADVIKVEDPGGDRQRREVGKIAPAPDVSATFLQLNRNKRSVVLDLKQDEDRVRLERLIATADVFVHNMRPEAVDRLGFGYDRVRALRPDIVYAAASGYGEGGAYSGRQAFDDLIQGISGASALLPLYDGQDTPRPLPSYLADKACGLFMAIGVLAALNHRARTGEGQRVDVPMFETFAGFLLVEHLHGHAYSPARGRFGHPAAVTPFRTALRATDGYIMVLAQDTEASDRFLALGGIEADVARTRIAGAPDGRGRLAAYHAMLAEAAATRSVADWMDAGARANVPLMAVNRLEDLPDDPHLRDVGFFSERLIDEAVGRYVSMAPGWRFSGTPASVRRDPPRLGQHSEAIRARLDDDPEAAWLD